MMTEHIVVGVDGSASALHATRWAAIEATLRRAHLRLVHVRELPVLATADRPLRGGVDRSGDQVAGRRGDRGTYHSALQVHTELRTGRAIEELADESEDATMVVVGSRRLGGFRNLLLGSVANTLTALANCPIVVIRGRMACLPPSGQWT